MPATEVIVIKNCPFCGREHEKTFPRDGWEKYKSGEFVQVAFPDMSVDDREFLISGVCPTCWDKHFGEEH